MQDRRIQSAVSLSARIILYLSDPVCQNFKHQLVPRKITEFTQNAENLVKIDCKFLVRFFTVFFSCYNGLVDFFFPNGLICFCDNIKHDLRLFSFEVDRRMNRTYLVLMPMTH